jgi:hypothetical protein
MSIKQRPSKPPNSTAIPLPSRQNSAADRDLQIAYKPLISNHSRSEKDEFLDTKMQFSAELRRVSS